jgi:hypothetical protein
MRQKPINSNLREDWLFAYRSYIVIVLQKSAFLLRNPRMTKNQEKYFYSPLSIFVTT